MTSYSTNEQEQARREEEIEEAEEMVCPVCGYYCSGKGGYGCIDKGGYLEILKR